MPVNLADGPLSGPTGVLRSPPRHSQGHAGEPICTGRRLTNRALKRLSLRDEILHTDRCAASDPAIAESGDGPWERTGRCRWMNGGRSTALTLMSPGGFVVVRKSVCALPNLAAPLWPVLVPVTTLYMTFIMQLILRHVRCFPDSGAPDPDGPLASPVLVQVKDVS